MALTGTVQKFEDLPSTPVEGARYKVVGGADTGFASYYVQGQGGVYVETVDDTINNTIDPRTMPHALIRQPDGSFIFAPFTWQPRRVGDAKTNPTPAYVGRPIRDVFFYANRLGLLADETVTFSAAGDYSDFWRRTVLDYVESDALAVSATTTDVAILDYAVPFNDGIMLFSAQRQFSLSNGENGLSARTVEIKPVTNYLMAGRVRPAPLGAQVYFASDGGGNVQVQEYTRLEGTDATDAAEVTAHVPGLIPSGVTQIVAASDLNAAFIVSRGSPRVFPYQFFWNGDEKVVSAWREWDFGEASVLSGAFFDGQLTLLMEREGQYSLEALDLRPNARSPSQVGLIHLDRAVIVTGTYRDADDRTVFTLPYVPAEDTLRLVRTAADPHADSMIRPTSYRMEGPTTVSVPGREAFPVTIGQVYRTYFRFSRQYPQDYQGRPLSTGRLQLTQFTVSFADTAYLESEVLPYGPNVVDPSLVSRTTFNGRLLGDASYRLGSLNYYTGSHSFPVAADAKLASVAIVNETPYAMTLVSAEWEGKYWNRAR